MKTGIIVRGSPRATFDSLFGDLMLGQLIGQELIQNVTSEGRNKLPKEIVNASVPYNTLITQNKDYIMNVCLTGVPKSRINKIDIVDDFAHISLKPKEELTPDDLEYDAVPFSTGYRIPDEGEVLVFYVDPMYFDAEKIKTFYDNAELKIFCPHKEVQKEHHIIDIG